MGRDANTTISTSRAAVDILVSALVVSAFVLPPLALAAAAFLTIAETRAGNAPLVRVYGWLLGLTTLTTAGLVAGLAGDRTLMLYSIVISIALALRISIAYVWSRRTSRAH